MHFLCIHYECRIYTFRTVSHETGRRVGLGSEFVCQCVPANPITTNQSRKLARDVINMARECFDYVATKFELSG